MVKVLEFLEEHARLCRKYGMFIGACGCCDSLWIVEEGMPFQDTVEEHIEHLRREVEAW